MEISLIMIIIRSILIAIFSAITLSNCGTDVFSSVEKGDVMLYWSAPTERANGDSMTVDEIGGYEIRYRASSDDLFTSIMLDSNTDQYLLTDVPINDSAIFQVAVFDSDGIYSDFVTAVEP